MKPKIILGLDIGGANTKGALLEFYNQRNNASFSYIEYFPFWEQSLKDVSDMFRRIINELIIKNNYLLNSIDNIAVTITAELSDAFQTKKEGILNILEALEQVFDKSKLAFMSNSNKFLNFNEAKEAYATIAAANWVSTALFLGKFVPNCILIEI